MGTLMSVIKYSDSASSARITGVWGGTALRQTPTGKLGFTWTRVLIDPKSPLPSTALLKPHPFFHAKRLHHGSPTRGPPGCNLRSAATFINCVYTIKLTQQFRQLDEPLIVIFATCAPRTRLETHDLHNAHADDAASLRSGSVSNHLPLLVHFSALSSFFPQYLITFNRI
jgi:hypothetical protein